MQLLAEDAREPVDAIVTRAVEDLPDLDRDRLSRLVRGFAEAIAWPEKSASATSRSPAGRHGRQRWLALDKSRLGELIDLVGTSGLGDRENRSKDTLGRVYECFLSQFASAEGKKGGQFYTPQSVVRVLVEMLAPYKGRVYDPCCGSGGMFVQSEKFLEAYGGKLGDISVYGQESNHTTWKLAKMNLAIRGIDGNLGPTRYVI